MRVVTALRIHFRHENNVFINPMWQDEVQRIGKMRCTPAGYRLHVLSDLIGFCAILLLPGVLVYLAWTAVWGGFTLASSGLLLIPIAVALAGNLLHSYSWHLADSRGFQYDYEKRTATWRTPQGAVEIFTYEDWREQFAPKASSSDT